jgi:hypothetical protein
VAAPDETKMRGVSALLRREPKLLALVDPSCWDADQMTLTASPQWSQVERSIARIEGARK